uniref:Prostaglandin F2-alpha receptor-like n=1 Tax=Crassostrea virginica TaxID=6565 RepID=A0A8B8D5M3_CRAVI|nr:prostaglandin F2-alpha receptor-like [Crassostrea virginica]
MDVNSSCISETTSPVVPIIIHSSAGLSSLVAVAWLSRSMYKQRDFSQPKFLALAVCFSDLLFTTLSNSQTLAATWLGQCRMGGRQGCIIRGFSRNSTMVASHLMVVLMATDRFIALRFPFRYQQLMKPRRVITVAISLYLYAISLATLPLLGVNSYGYELWCDFYWNDTSPGGRCFVIFFLLQGFGCMAFTVFCNISVIYELLGKNRKVGPEIYRTSFKEKFYHFKFITLLIVVSISYIGCSTPYLVRLACNQFGYDLSEDKDFFAVRVYLVNNMTNSYFILFIQVLFRPTLVKKLQVCCQRNLKGNDINVIENQTSERALPQ